MSDLDVRATGTRPDQLAASPETTPDAETLPARATRHLRNGIDFGRTSRGKATYLATALLSICALLAISPTTASATSSGPVTAQGDAVTRTASADAAFAATASVGATAHTLTPLAREVRVSRMREIRANKAHLAVLRAELRHIAAVEHARAVRIRAHRLAVLRLKLERVRVLPIWRHYVIGEGFGVRGWHWGGGIHTGIDLDVPTGTHVHAAEAGYVISAKWEGSYGNCIRIRHYNGVVTRYAHLSKIVAKTGEYVEAGDYIGNVGSTGNTTGPHLHFEVIVNGTPVNPKNWLR